MDNYYDMRKFIQSVAEYLKHHGDACASELQRQLQIIASASAMDTFDPSIGTVVQFFASLHELMNGLDSRSMLVWSAISVLQKVCTNQDAKTTLIHTFKFIPVLTKFLSFEQIGDKQMRLLLVMKELTYGVKIFWEEAHLPYLVTVLVKIIMEGSEEFKAISLEVLVNLCYDNLPVLYILMGKVDIKNFTRYIAQMDDNSLIRIHVCKMLMVLHQTKGNLPKKDILNCLHVVFNTVEEAFLKRNSSLLKQIVDFFKDIKENPHFGIVSSRYEKCDEDIRKVVKMAEEISGDETGECLSILIEFIHDTFTMNFEKTSGLVNSVISLAVRYLQDDTTSLSCLKIFKMIAELTTSEGFNDVDGSIYEKMSQALPGLLCLMDVDDDSMKNVPTKKKLTQLTELLTIIASNVEYRKEIVSIISCENIRCVFKYLFKCSSWDQEPVFHPDNGKLCVKMLTFVSKLAQYNSDWLLLSGELLNKRHVLMELAISFADGNKYIKYEILELSASKAWNKESLIAFCDLMTNLRSTGVVEKIPPAASTMRSPRNVMPFYSGLQESRLNELLEALRKVKDEGKLGESPTSSVMELYEYKLGALGQAERRVQAALEASDSRCTGLNHQVAQLRNEVLRLQERLFSYQLFIEGAKAEKENLTDKEKVLREQLNAEKTHHKRQLKELQNQIQILERALATSESGMKTRVKEYQASESKKKERISELEGRCEKLTKHVETLEASMQKDKADSESKIKNLCKEIQDLKAQLMESKQLNLKKEQQLLEQKKIIEDLERVRTVILNVATKKN